MSNFDDFLKGLDPKIAKSIKTASQVETIRYPLASRRLTYALGGGVGAGRITTIYGNQSAGKSLLSLQSIGRWQKQGLVCGFVDVEGTYDKEFSARLGVNNDELLVTGSKSSGRIIDEVTPWLEGGIDILVLDSISDIMPEVFVDKDGLIKDSENLKQIGAQAKAITGMINAFQFANKHAAIILLSQTTTKMETWGAVQVPHGGQKTLFASSQMIRLASSNTEAKAKTAEVIVPGGMKATERVGRPVEATIEKNKLGPQSRVAKYDIYYQGDQLGVNRDQELISMCAEFGIVKKGGAGWYTMPDETKVQGDDNFVAILKADNDLKQALEEQLEKALAEAKNFPEPENEGDSLIGDGQD